MIEDEPPIVEMLSKCVFLYDPLDRGNADFWTRTQFIKAIDELQGIPQKESDKLFRMVLNYEDERKLLSVYNMTMTCSYSIKRLILHLTILIIRTCMSVKSKVKMTSSLMPLTLVTFALPQFMAQHNCEDLKPTDTPSSFSTFTQDSSDLMSNQICAHHPMATQCNQSQYLTLLKQICAHNPSSSQVRQANLSNSLTSQYPPDPGEQVLKKSATEIGEQDFPVKKFKFIYPSSKPRMTETSALTPVQVVYSPIAFMIHQWTINLHDRYPPLHVLLPEEYISPSSHPL